MKQTMEHTKGEWKVMGAEFTEEGTVLYEIKLPIQQLNIADSHLIEAGPYMIEALKGIVADLENVVHPNVLEATLEALAKAERK